MKTLERILAIVSIIAIVAVIVTLVIQWRKDGDLWRALKSKFSHKKMMNLED